MEVYDNTTAAVPFPFQVVDGAQVQKGCLGVHACCIYLESVAFLGSGRNEAPAIYIAEAATTSKISTQEIDNLLTEYTEAQLALVLVEARNNKNHQFLYVHLPDKALVYDASSSQALQVPVWFILTSSIIGFSQYRARNMVWVYDKWMIGDPESSSIGFLVQDIGSNWGEQVYWEFGTLIMYAEGKGALMQQLELVSLTGSVALGTNPQISTSYSINGLSYSQDRSISVGTIGSNKRLSWFQQGHMRNFRIQRFKGNSDAHVSFVRLEAKIEALAY